MILTYNDVSKLKGADWYMVELRSEKTVENTMRRMVKAIPSIFRDEALEIFVPVFHRDLDAFDMKVGCYIFARSTSFQGLLRLKSITGVVGLVTLGDSQRPNKAIKTEDSFVQGIIKDVEKSFHARAEGIKVGTFVRLLDGETRDYCGHVQTIKDGVAVVRIDLKTKRILVETPVRNLLNLNHIPQDRRVFYYCPLVEEFIGDHGVKPIAEDLKPEEDWHRKNLLEIPNADGKLKKYTRQRTVTALVKRLVIEGARDPRDIAKKVVAAIKKHEIKTPKNLFIVYCIIKNNLRNHFRRQDPRISNYREVIRRFGRKYKFSAQDIADIDPDLGVPISTIEVCQDGRSREARMKKRAIYEQAEAEKLAKRERRRKRRRERKERQRREREAARAAMGGQRAG